MNTLNKSFHNVTIQAHDMRFMHTYHKRTLHLPVALLKRFFFSLYVFLSFNGWWLRLYCSTWGWMVVPFSQTHTLSVSISQVCLLNTQEKNHFYQCNIITLSSSSRQYYISVKWNANRMGFSLSTPQTKTVLSVKKTFFCVDNENFYFSNAYLNAV